MKTTRILSLLGLTLAMFQLPGSAHGQRAIARWNLGENDPGAADGAAGSSTTADAAGTRSLAKFGTPSYSGDVPAGGSSLSMSFNGTDAFYQASTAGLWSGVPLTNFILSCDVKIASLPDFSFPVSIGKNGGGMAIVQIGGNWYLIHQGAGASAAGSAVQANTWTHLDFVRSNGVSYLYVNGALDITFPHQPAPAADFFTIGANEKGDGSVGNVEGLFPGLIDNVVLTDPSLPALPVVVADLAGDYRTPAPKAGWRYLKSTAASGGSETDLVYGDAVGSIGNIGYGGGGNGFNLPCVLGAASTGNFRIFGDGGNGGVLGADLLLHPGDDLGNLPPDSPPFVIMRYTFSAADLTHGSQALIAGSFRRALAGSDGVEAYVFKNSAQLFAAKSPGALLQTDGSFSLNVTVAEGDSISFVLGKNGHLFGDESAVRGAISLSPAPPPPAVSSGPTISPGPIVFTGGAFSLSVSAQGGQPLSFQWRHDGTNLPGAASNVFAIANATAADSGAYDVVITNAAGALTSSVVRVTVDSAVLRADAGADFRESAPKPGWEYLGSTAATGGSETPLTWGGTVGNAGNVGYGGGANTYNLPAVLGTVSGSSGFKMFGDGHLNGGELGVDVLVHAADPVLLGGGGLPYVILRYTVDPIDVEDYGAQARIVGSFRELITGGDSVEVYVFQNGIQLFHALGSGDTLLQNDGAFNIVTTVAGLDTISFVVGIRENLSGDETAIRASIALSAQPLPPEIVSGPVVTPGSIVYLGGSFTLSLQAAGTGPLSYEWRQNGTVVATTIEGSATFNNVTFGQSGKYDVVVSSDYGAVTSAVVNVTVDAPPTLVADLGADYRPDAPKAGWQYLASTAATGGSETPLSYGSPVGSVGNIGYGGGGNGFNLPCVLGAASTGDFRVFGDGGNAGVPGTDLLLHPGDNLGHLPPDSPPFVILRYTVSGADLAHGTQAAIAGGFRRANGAGDGVEGYVYKNSTQLFYVASATSLAQSAGAFDLLTEVAEGDTISFVLGMKGDLFGDESALRGTISLSPAAAATLRVHLSGGQAVIMAQGRPGRTYLLQRSLVLPAREWTDVAASPADLSGAVQLVDPAPPAEGAFYRAVTP